MKIGKAQLSPWEPLGCYALSADLEQGDYFIVDTEYGEDIAKLVEVQDINEAELKGQEIREMKRKASFEDLEKIASPKKRQEALNYCRERVLSLNLEMKLVDVHIALNNSKITFAFIADGRVDFRELVKDLTSHFKTQIRLNQIGTRDEAKIQGDCGPCGRHLCCRKFIKEFSSITSEMAENQQVVHRGSERISGMCGRLMCCLAYEDEGYKEMDAKMPPIGAKVNVDGQKGEVVSHHILKQSVDVRFPGKNGEGDAIVEVDLNRKKKS